MQMVFCPRTGWAERSATGITPSLRMTSGDACRACQDSRAAAQLIWTSAALPEKRDEQENWLLRTPGGRVSLAPVPERRNWMGWTESNPWGWGEWRWRKTTRRDASSWKHFERMIQDAIRD